MDVMLRKKEDRRIGLRSDVSEPGCSKFVLHIATHRLNCLATFSVHLALINGCSGMI